MQRKIEALEAETFDVAIIGGGITGACIALDAVTRGLSVALVEKGDFGAATSAASSKLLHGGIRYLQQGRLGKLRESATERAYFQTLAPHLSRYVPFVVPAYPGFRKGRFVLGVALAIYEALCTGQNRHIDDSAKHVPTGRLLGREQIRKRVPEPCSREMTGGVLLYESHMHDSERMTLSFIKTAASQGAVVANYVRADSFLRTGGRVVGFRGRDVLDGSDVEVRASLVVNAAGPWIPLVNRALERKRGTNIVTALARGAHIVTKPLTDGHALALPIREQNQALINRGGRHVFIIPWQGHSLIGTTYALYEGDPDEVEATEADVHELMDIVNTAFGTRVLSRADVVHAYAGLYPLTDTRIDPNAYQGTADYQIIDHERTDRVEGLVSSFGAKFTTARRLAEHTIDLVAEKLEERIGPSKTRRMRLAGGAIEDLTVYREQKKREYASRLSAAVVEHLVTNYGTEIDDVLKMIDAAPELGEAVSPQHPTLAAEVVHAVRYEMARRLEDVMFRRSSLGTLGHSDLPTLRRCAALMAKELGWSEEKVDREVEVVHAKSFRSSAHSAGY